MPRRFWDNGKSRLLTVEGRYTEAMSVLEATAARLATPHFDAVLGAETRKTFHAGEIATIGFLGTQSYSDRPLEIADALDRLDSQLWSTFADQLRMVHYANRGLLEQAHEHQAKIEVRVVQGGLSWQTDIFVPTMLLAVSLLTGDLVAVRRIYEQLVRRARDFPSLEPYVDAAHAGYLTLRGDLSAGIAHWSAVQQRFPPNGRAGWAPVRWCYADALNRAGEHGRARAVVVDALTHTSGADQSFAIPYAELLRQLALAEAGLSNFAEAVKILDTFLLERRATPQLLVMGLFHKARAEVALAMDDAAAFLQHLSAARALFEQTRDPCLIAQWQRLAKAGEGAGPFAREVLAMEQSGPGGGLGGSRAGQPSSVGANGEQRCVRLLEHVMRQLDADTAYLYALRDNQLELVAGAPSGEPPASATAQLCALLDRARATGRSQHNPGTCPTRALAGGQRGHEGDAPDGDDRTETVFPEGNGQNIGQCCLLLYETDPDSPRSILGAVALTLRSDLPRLRLESAVSHLSAALRAAADVRSNEAATGKRLARAE